MIGRNKLVAVWLGANPGEKLLTICNCCLWKILPVINPSIGDKVTKMPVDEVMVTDKCGGCGTCMEGVCFVDAISLKEGIRV